MSVPTSEAIRKLKEVLRTLEAETERVRAALDILEGHPPLPQKNSLKVVGRRRSLHQRGDLRQRVLEIASQQQGQVRYADVSEFPRNSFYSLIHRMQEEHLASRTERGIYRITYTAAQETARL
jgi:hypothetical protein